MTDEVVTLAHLRQVRLPTGETIALITLDNGRDHSRPTTFGAEGLRRMEATIDAAASSDADAVAVTGKPFVFAVGADLTAAGSVADRAQALEIGRRGHQVFRRLGESAKPTFAFLNGVALGGGLELALHCDYRTLSGGVRAVGLPECSLGLVPGWGGSYLLPNLVGAATALTVMVENPLAQNRTMRARQAFQAGLADAIFEPVDFLELSLEWAGRVVRGEVAVARPEPDRGLAWDEAVRRGRALVDAKLHGAAPAPYRALDLVALAKTATPDEAFAAEDEAIADLLMGEEFRASRYAFDLVQRRARRPAGAPDAALARPVTKVGIVGAGLMAGQLALLFVRRLEVPVVLTDVDAHRLEEGVRRVHGQLDALHAERRMSADQANRLKALVSGFPAKDAFVEADLVVEAVFEDLVVKKQVLAEVEALVSRTTILATNTSALSVSEMAADLDAPQRVVGLHFCNPVAVLPLLEVVRGDRTDDVTLATAFAVGRELGKSCVLVKDAPAFVVNRLLTRFMEEVLRAVDEGTPREVADAAFEPLGLPMSPYALLQLVGPAVALHTAETLATTFPDRFAVSPGLRRLGGADSRPAGGVESAGGPQSGDGRPLSGPGRPLSGDEVRARALEALAEEIRLLLDEEVVASPADVDLCLLLGAGWPFHLGGITPYLDGTGISERVTGRRFLPKGVATLP